MTDPEPPRRARGLSGTRANFYADEIADVNLHAHL